MHLAETIAAACQINLAGYRRVQGGDINEAYCLQTKEKSYFLKLNEAARFPRMFELEADGLNALRANSTMVVPAVMQYGTMQDRQWLLLQWIEKESLKADSMAAFGNALAQMHQQQRVSFGWHTDNYIGSLPQVNSLCSNWPQFYTIHRIMPLVKILVDKGAFSKPDIVLGESFCKHAAELFPEEPPALLHGDLWSGNYMITTGGPAIFDPAVYCGHREMDMGMTKLFGGFTQDFYDAYQETYPLDKNWQQRLPVTQLYPLLVHAVLFGGHYISTARETMVKFGK